MSFDLGWMLILELLGLGCVAGFLAGLLGVGGGAMLVPFMTILMSFKGMPEQHVVKMAIATSLATICFTSISSVRAHHRRGAVRWPLVRLLAPGIMAGALVGAQIAKLLPSKVLALMLPHSSAFRPPGCSATANPSPHANCLKAQVCLRLGA